MSNTNRHSQMWLTLKRSLGEKTTSAFASSLGTLFRRRGHSFAEFHEHQLLSWPVWAANFSYPWELEERKSKGDDEKQHNINHSQLQTWVCWKYKFLPDCGDKNCPIFTPMPPIAVCKFSPTNWGISSSLDWAKQWCRMATRDASTFADLGSKRRIPLERFLLRTSQASPSWMQSEVTSDCFFTKP